MQLEDHIGDIIHKARAIRGLSATETGAIAGLTEPEFAAFEESGRVPKQFNLAAVATALGLDKAKLERIAAGWVPQVQNLARWHKLELISSTAGSNTVNCYLIWDESTAEAVLFDTGWDVQPVYDVLKLHQLKLKHIFITHMHADHIAALEQVQRAFPRAQVHPGLAPVGTEPLAKPSTPIELGQLLINMRPTPGHAKEAVSYIIENWPYNAPPVAIVGDAIFAGSIGWGFYSWTLSRRAVAEQILSLPDDTLICPGHGPLTTVGEEKAHNPFF